MARRARKARDYSRYGKVVPESAPAGRGQLFQTADLFSAVLPPMPKNCATHVRHHFADIADMAAPIPRDAKSEANWGYGSEYDSDRNRGCRTMADALDLARDGWQEGADKAHELRQGIEALAPHALKLARYDVAGAVPSVARAIAGNPMNMRTLTRKASANMPTITLVCDISVNWEFPGDKMIEHASAVAAVADMLEERGYRCELVVVARTAKTYGESICCEIAVRLKAPEQVANMASIAYGLGHAAMFRRLMFATWFNCADAQPIGDMLGSAMRCEPMPDRGTFTAPSATQAGGMRATPVRRFVLICKALREQGCPGIPDESDMPTTGNHNSDNYDDC